MIKSISIKHGFIPSLKNGKEVCKEEKWIYD